MAKAKKKTLPATAAQRLAAAEQKITGRSLDKAEVEKITKALEEAHAELSDPHLKARARVALRRVKLQAQADPISQRPRQPSNPGGPTPELAAKRKFEVEAVVPDQPGVPATNRHRPRSALKAYQDYFSMSEWTALEQWYRDGEAFTTVNVTSNYSGMTTAGTARHKTGGVGPNERLREMHVRFNWIRAHLMDIDPILLEIGRWVVLEYRAHEMEKLPSVADIGGILVPNLRDAATRRGVAIGVLKVFAMILRSLYRRDYALSRQPGPQMRARQVTLQPEIEAPPKPSRRRA